MSLVELGIVCISFQFFQPLQLSHATSHERNQKMSYEVHYTKGSCANPEIRKLNPDAKSFDTIAEAKVYMDEYAGGDEEVRCDLWLRDTKLEPKRRGPKMNQDSLEDRVFVTQSRLAEYLIMLLDSRKFMESGDPVRFRLSGRRQQAMDRWQLWLKGELK